MLKRLLALAGLSFAVALLTGACSALPGLRDELAVEPSTDCAKAAGEPDGFDYWVVGLTPEPVYWRGCDKAGATLANSIMATSEMLRIDLRDADLRGADLRATNLHAANLAGADLAGSRLQAANLRGANLAGANLRGTDLTGIVLFETRLDGATWSDGSVCAPGSLGRCVRE